MIYYRREQATPGTQREKPASSGVRANDNLVVFTRTKSSHAKYSDHNGEGENHKPFTLIQPSYILLQRSNIDSHRVGSRNDCTVRARKKESCSGTARKSQENYELQGVSLSLRRLPLPGKSSTRPGAYSLALDPLSAAFTRFSQSAFVTHTVVIIG